MDRSFRAHAALTAVVNRICAAVLGPLHQDLVAERGEAPHPGPHVGVRLLAGSGNRARRQVGEARLLVLAGLMVTADLAASRDEISRLKNEIVQISENLRRSEGSQGLDRLAVRLEGIAAKLESA